jgi:hypothetical protein
LNDVSAPRGPVRAHAAVLSARHLTWWRGQLTPLRVFGARTIVKTVIELLAIHRNIRSAARSALALKGPG